MTTTETTRHPKMPRPDLRFISRTKDVPLRSGRPLLTVRADPAQWAALNYDGIAGQHGQPGRFAEWPSRIPMATAARSSARPFRHDSDLAADDDGSGYQCIDTDDLRWWPGTRLAAFGTAHGCTTGEGQ
jgi:hypothetical protein